jgi:hypothetical protein
LDLRGKRERACPLSPFEQVGVPAVGDHHERQRVRRPGHPLHDRVGRCGGQGDLQQADGLTALGDRRSDEVLVSVELDQHALRTQRLFLQAAVEGHHHRHVLVLAAAVLLGVTDRNVDEAHESSSAHVRHEERHPQRVEADPDTPGHRRHGVDRRGSLHCEQHVVEVHGAHLVVDHAAEHRRDAGDHQIQLTSADLS